MFQDGKTQRSAKGNRHHGGSLPRPLSLHEPKQYVINARYAENAYWRPTALTTTTTAFLVDSHQTNAGYSVTITGLVKTMTSS